MSKIVKPEVLTAKEALDMALRIPDYQRPYVWTTENVSQLLSDIRSNMSKARYRIGSIILHKHQGWCDIIDGQQRVTTLCLLRKAIGKDEPKCFSELKYQHTDSFAHIKENYEYIVNWLKGVNIESYAEYLDNKCEFVVTSIEDEKSEHLSLAFKLFDSQNGRGKTLEAYNLLKAYHIRAMGDNDEEAKRRCDKKWEGNVNYQYGDRGIDILKQIFGEQLYRTRQWSKMLDAWYFGKPNLSEFKGVQGNKSKFPFQNTIAIMSAQEKLYEALMKDAIPTSSRFSSGVVKDVNPFVQMNQTIVNGKNFFEYTGTYAEIYKKMFLEDDSIVLDTFRKFYLENCERYSGAARTGDGYVKEAYKSVCMLMLDRFGEEVLNSYFKHLYVIVYSIRNNNIVVKYPTVAKCDDLKYLFFTVASAMNESQLGVIKNRAIDIANNQNDKFENQKFKDCFNAVVVTIK